MSREDHRSPSRASALDPRRSTLESRVSMPDSRQGRSSGPHTFAVIVAIDGADPCAECVVVSKPACPACVDRPLWEVSSSSLASWVSGCCWLAGALGVSMAKVAKPSWPRSSMPWLGWLGGHLELLSARSRGRKRGGSINATHPLPTTMLLHCNTPLPPPPKARSPAPAPASAPVSCISGSVMCSAYTGALGLEARDFLTDGGNRRLAAMPTPFGL